MHGQMYLKGMKEGICAVVYSAAEGVFAASVSHTGKRMPKSAARLPSAIKISCRIR